MCVCVCVYVICQSSKILLSIILKRLNLPVEEILSEEQAVFRKGRSTIEQVFNCRNIIEKHLDSQKNQFHNFIDFKKAFDRVYHDGLWSALNKFGIQNDIIMMLKLPYANSTNAVLLNNVEGENSLKLQLVYVKDVCFHQHYSTYSLKKL